MDHPARTQAGDTVIAVVPEGRRPFVLAAIHRAGLGALARVFDPARGAVALQLRRAGLPALPESDLADPSASVLVLTVPGRASMAAAAISVAGADRVYITSRMVADELPPLLPSDQPSDPLP